MPNPPVDNRDISVNITDGTNPVKGATVSIGTITGTTGNAGGCTLKNVTDGEQTINVTAFGFEDKTSTITVSEDNTSFNIALTRIVYDFTSYDSETKDTEWGSGTAILTGEVSGDYTEIEVLTNTEPEFVGNKYFIVSNAETDGTTVYQLYTDAGTTGAGIYVTISIHE